ncbi:GNAT family N-acetyltransferase [Paraburkholderia sp. CNPSo 3076]|uniref:GNAT family N-acetyltransferase n=1 Tax=Paraburkholderia sp. CNPSo 3076 TaxID=2940936 RepID=UPI002259872B|nr:GNAT family N-acetyltransferase [Paraburkholderia sp. CNPSo 3076]MCX5539979.1 GNAT family N-acetyltransferase [Paraburkholderia sp. CNPSo 3076]
MTDGRRAVACRIEAICVTSSFWNRGVGTALMITASERLYAEGYSAVTLWVLRDNKSAQSFYDQRGFRPTGQPRSSKLVAPP